MSAIKSGELFASTGASTEAPAAPATADVETSAGAEPKQRGYVRSATLPASSGTYQPEGLPPMVWSTPQRGEDSATGASLTLDPAATAGGVKASADMSGKPPMSGGGFKTPSMSGGVDAPSMSGGFKTPSMSGGAKTPSMSGGMKTPSMSGGADVPSMSGGVETPSMSGGMDLPAASPASVSFDKPTVDTGFVPAPGAGGPKVTTPTTSATKIAARSPAANAYVARITTPKADKGTTPEEPELKRLSSSGLVGRLKAGIEHRGPSPAVRRDGAGGFGFSSSGPDSGDAVGVPKVEVKTVRSPPPWGWWMRMRECPSAYASAAVPQCLCPPTARPPPPNPGPQPTDRPPARARFFLLCFPLCFRSPAPARLS